MRHGTDDTLRYPDFGEQIKQWTNVHGLSRTPMSTDTPQSGHTRTRCGDVAITAKSLTLDLNGTSFVGLRHGTGHTVSGDTPALTAVAVARLVGNRAYGVNATVEARFSQGIPWRIDLISYDTRYRRARPGRPR